MGAVRLLRVGRVGSAGIFGLAGRPSGCHPHGVRERRHRIRRLDVPQRHREPGGRRSPAPPALPGVARDRGSSPAPPSPARRRLCAATSPGWSGRVACEADPARSLRAPSGGGRLPRVLSGGEMSSLLDVPADTPVDRRDLAVLELLYAAGLRVSELCGLDRGDIDLRGRTVTVLGKGGKQRRVPMHDAAVAALRAWFEDGRDDMEGPPEAAFVNRRGAGSGPGTSGASWTAARPRPPTRTPCATPTPPTCSTGVLTSGSSRSCWATPAWPPRRCTPTSARSACAPSTGRPTPGPELSLPSGAAERLAWSGPPGGGRQYRPTSPARVPRSSPSGGAAPGEQPTGGTSLWPSFPCDSFWRPESTSATRRADGTRR